MWAGGSHLPHPLGSKGDLQYRVQIAFLLFTSGHPRASRAESIRSAYSPCRTLARIAWNECGQAKGHYVVGLDLCGSHGAHLICWTCTRGKVTYEIFFTIDLDYTNSLLMNETWISVEL